MSLFLKKYALKYLGTNRVLIPTWLVKEKKITGKYVKMSTFV